MTELAPYSLDKPLRPPPGSGVRASDAEREQVARILRAAAGEGLLTLGEADERLVALYASRFRAELEPLTADLPDGDARCWRTPPRRGTLLAPGCAGTS